MPRTAPINCFTFDRKGPNEAVNKIVHAHDREVSPKTGRYNFSTCSSEEREKEREREEKELM
jgi:hypothetical protein